MPVCLPLRPSTQNLVWDLINMQNVLNQVSDRSSHLTGKCRKNSKLSAFGPWRLLCHAKLQRHSWRICFVYICLTGNWPSVLWRCWLGGRKSVRPEQWGAGVVICLERGADLHMAQLMPLHSLSLASVKSRLVLPFWYRLTWVVK